MHRFLLYNGEIHGTGEPLISPGQTGFMNGWGVFSTIRVFDGVLFAFSRHYARMQRDAALMHVPFPFSEQELESQLLRLVDANAIRQATLRAAVVRNRGGLFEGANIRRDADLVAFTADISDWGQGVRLCTVRDARQGASPFSGTKVTSWCQNLTWNEQAHEMGFDEALLLNEHGAVSECTSANVFLIRRGEVVTPPLTAGCLPGVTRALLLEEISADGMRVREQDIMPEELQMADQVFITSTTRNLLPVLSVDGQELSQSPEVFGRLSAAFDEYQAKYVKAHPRSRETVHV